VAGAWQRCGGGEAAASQRRRLPAADGLDMASTGSAGGRPSAARGWRPGAPTSAHPARDLQNVTKPATESREDTISIVETLIVTKRRRRGGFVTLCISSDRIALRALASVTDTTSRRESSPSTATGTTAGSGNPRIRQRCSPYHRAAAST
jgi:hypothetical protein